MTNWERVALRVQGNKLRKWDAVCTPFDPDLDDDEFPNSFPHLYDDRSKLIREAVEELISREAGDLRSSDGEVTPDTSEVEEKVELVRADTRDILDVIEDVQARQEEIIQEAITTDEDITADLYSYLPSYETRDEAFTEISVQAKGDEEFVYPTGHRAEEYGYWRDIAEANPEYSYGTVLDNLRELERSVESIARIEVDGYVFFVEVEDE
jgi:hypothetical protein